MAERIARTEHVSMKILIVTNHFFPEEFKVNSMALELKRRGHDISVLTAIPDYPQGTFHKGYGVFSKRVEKWNGIRIYRSLIIPRGKGGTLRMAMNYLSLTLSQIFNSLILAVSTRYDQIIVYETSPVMVGIPAVCIKKLRHTPVLFWVQDLWPESLTAAGGINNRFVIGLFEKLTRWIYRNSTLILISSESFRESIIQKGDFAKKIVYFPQWAEDASVEGYPEKMPEMPAGFKVMFAGNIGEAQDFEHIMEASRILKDEDIHFVILGDGRKRNWVQEFVKKHELERTVHLLGRHPAAMMPCFFEKADIMLVALKDELIFNLTLPAKIQAYMFASKPIIAMMNGEGPRVIAEAGGGISVPAGDSEGLVKAICDMKKASKQTLELMGEKNKRYCEEHFSIKGCIDYLEEIMRGDSIVL